MPPGAGIGAIVMQVPAGKQGGPLDIRRRSGLSLSINDGESPGFEDAEA